jgi:hypothetical protein
MRDLVFWLSGATLAFLLTAGAFLLLANLATAPSEKSLAPGPGSGGSGHTVDLRLDRERLASLKPLPDQRLDLVVENEGAEHLSDVNVVLIVSSENTALADSRFYRQTVERIPAGGVANVHFEFDLAAPKRPSATRPPIQAPEPSREILELRATTPEGGSTVRTVILPP